MTIFPEIALGPLSESMMRRARSQGALDLRVHDLRQWALDRHRKTDDEPFGGGPGMVMKPEPFFACIEELRGPVGDSKGGPEEPAAPAARVILMTPSGRRFDQAAAQRLAGCDHLILLCGHYEGVDQRVIDCLVDEELSLGDFVLTNGAVAAAVVTDAVVRLLPGVLGDAQSAVTESFSAGRLDWPQYTRPAEFRGMAVPEVLRGGDHGAIQTWREEQALALTRARRPDLLGEG